MKRTTKLTPTALAMATVNRGAYYHGAKVNYRPAPSRAERGADKLRPTLKEDREIKLTKRQLASMTPTRKPKVTRVTPPPAGPLRSRGRRLGTFKLPPLPHYLEHRTPKFIPAYDKPENYMGY